LTTENVEFLSEDPSAGSEDELLEEEDKDGSAATLDEACG
jgi:hypothetical protein